MPSVLQLLPHALSQQAEQVLYGIVSERQPLPTTYASTLHVVFPDIDPNVFWTVEGWASSYGLPTAGAPVTAFFDNRNNLRCVVWNPHATPTISGSRGGNAAVANLLTTLAALGIILDGTTA